MKKLKLTLIFILFTTIFSNAQSNIFYGDWLLYKIENNGIPKKENTKFKFVSNGSIIANSFEFGTWIFNKNKMEVDLKSIFQEEEFNGVHKVNKLTNKELVFSKNKITYYFTRIDLKKIAENNKSSNLIGSWKLNHKDFDDLFLKLELPNTFTFISVSSNTTTSKKGEWEFLKETNELNLEGIQFILKGKSRIKDVSNDFLALVRPQETLIFNKVDVSTIEWLNFTIDNIKTSQSNESSLPEAWKNNENYISHLSNIQSITYSYGNYIPEAKALIYSKILKKIKTNTSKQSVSLSNILITKYDTLQYSENYKGHLMNQNNFFFPREEPDYYRVIGKENINGYTCTVIEGFLEDTKLKYWMIDNQPGVYAKIIEQLDHDYFNKMDYKVLTILKHSATKQIK